MENKFCKDCKHSKGKSIFEYNYDVRRWFCYRQLEVHYDPIDGREIEYGVVLCNNERSRHPGLELKYCDLDGKFFEPKKKWWKIWK